MGFLAGVTSSFGPCIAPRFLAIASFTAETSGAQRFQRVGAFAAGLCTSYVLLGTIAGALGYVAKCSPYIYLTLSLCLVAAGFVTLARPAATCCPSEREGTKIGFGAAFSAGLAFSAIASPCCGPIAAVIGGMSAASGSVVFGALMLCAFALGHAVPLFALAAGSVPVSRLLRWHAFGLAASLLSGALMIALGAYYAVLA